jgi:glutaredoxin 3
VEIDQKRDGSTIQAVLPDMTGVRMVPQVFMNGRFIGGGKQAAAAAREGSLQKLLAS